MEGSGRRPKPPPSHLKAVLVEMLFEINSLSKLVDRLRYNPDLASICGARVASLPRGLTPK